jgi:hypothetical protein
LRFVTFLVMSITPAAFGGLLTLPGQNDSVDFSSYSFNTNLGGTFLANSTGGNSIAITEPSSSFAVFKQNSGWAGNFPDKTILIFNQGGGIVTFAFTTPIEGFGLNIDDAIGGNYTASIGTFDGATSETQFTTPSEPYGLVFVSQVDATADITSVTIGTGAFENNDFAFSNISLIEGSSPTPPSGVPEPASIGGTLLGLVSLGAAAKFRGRV